MSAALVQELLHASGGRAPDVIASAPGRVNLLGEHTDYNGGYVLPTVIPQRAWIALARRDDHTVSVHSRELGSASYELDREAHRGQWIDYVQGVTASLREHGHPVRGFDAALLSDVPLGSGLSSSAALEVALLRGLRELLSLKFDDIELAGYAKWGENSIVKAPVGILDPFACSVGEPGVALFLDTRTMRTRRVPIPPEIDVVVIDSGVAHDHAHGDYRTRRAECDEAARLLNVVELRDVEPGDPRIAKLAFPYAARARHVISENARVLRGIEALERRDFEALGTIFYESHASMRDDYEVSVPRVDAIVEAARSLAPDVIGARLTGGGFGGAVVVLVRAGSGPRVADALTTSLPEARALVRGDAR